jgi:hypothetical protein
MNKFDNVIYDLVNIYEKYDLFWRTTDCYLYGRDMVNDPWGHNQKIMYANTPGTRINNQFALIELLDSHREVFKDYVCPYSKLVDLIETQKGLSDDAKEVLSTLTKRCIDTERERKLWIHNWLRTNCSNNFEKNIKKIIKHKTTRDLNLTISGDIETMTKDIKSQYFEKFPIINILRPSKELINFAQGNKKYYIWDDEFSDDELAEDFFGNYDFIYLIEPLKSAIKYVEIQNNVEDIKVKNQIEKLKRQSNNIAKVGIFKRFQNLFCKIG